jgi:hypothetical protein
MRLSWVGGAEVGLAAVTGILLLVGGDADA